MTFLPTDRISLTPEGLRALARAQTERDASQVAATTQSRLAVDNHSRKIVVGAQTEWR